MNIMGETPMYRIVEDAMTEDVTRLRGAFLEEMYSMLLSWSKAKFCHTRLDGGFDISYERDGSKRYRFGRNVFHFTPAEWNNEDVQSKIERLEGLKAEIAELAEKQQTEFMLPAIIEGAQQIRIGYHQNAEVRTFERENVLERLEKERDQTEGEFRLQQLSEMIGAVKAVSDEELRGRRMNPAWQAYIYYNEEDKPSRIRRMKYGLIHIGNDKPYVRNTSQGRTKKWGKYKGDPLARIAFTKNSTPWEFWRID